MAAAEALKFSVMELHTDERKALAVGAHEGVLKSSGRMIVGSVPAEVYRRIEEYVRKGSSGDARPSRAARPRQLQNPLENKPRTCPAGRVIDGQT